ncbi:MAG: YfhO family protein [Thermoanaerobaculia bacterium]
MHARRRLASGLAAAAALLPALLWLRPPILERLAPSYRDQGDFFYPLKLSTAQRLRSGEIPLWNPLSGAGEPWLANGQSGVFYPPTWLFLLPSPALAGGLFLLLHFAIAAWGARRFLKEENVSDAGALMGAAAFAASGVAASLSAYWNHFGAFAFLPGIAALARSGLRTRASVAGLAALTGLQAMAGSPEISAATLALALVLVLRPRAAFPEPVVEPPRSLPLRRFAAAVALGLALSAWMLVPLVELAVRSDRRGPLPAAERDLGAIRAGEALSFAGWTPSGPGNAYLASLFLPPFVLVAAVAAFREDHRRPLALVLAAICLAGVLLAMHGPPGSWLRALPFLDRIRYPSKALALPAFGVAMLAGLGTDSLRFVPAGSRGRVVFGALSVCALALAAMAPQPFLVRLACGVGSACLGLLALGAGRRGLTGALLAGTSAVGLVAALAWALLPLQRFAEERALATCPEPTSRLSAVAGRIVTPPMASLSGWALRDDRFDAGMLERQRAALLGYTNLTCRVPTVRTAAALATRGAQEIAASIGDAEEALPAGAASARVLWTPFRPSKLPSRQIEGFFRAPIAPYRPRLSFLRAYSIEQDPSRAWARVASGRIDLTREVVLDRRPTPDPSGGDASAPLLIARLAEDRPERVVAELTTSFPGLLVLTDLHYPGWLAEENGKRLPILRADGWFRAVALPPGEHRVVFRYRPISFYAGAAVSVVALLTLLVIWGRGEPVRLGRKPA